MSVENVKAFYEMVMSDENLRKSLKDLGEKSKDNKDEAIADLIALGKENGFEFEPDHWAELVQAGAGELSESELAEVAGGGIPECKPVFIVICDEMTPFITCTPGMAF